LRGNPLRRRVAQHGNGTLAIPNGLRRTIPGGLRRKSHRVDIKTALTVAETETSPQSLPLEVVAVTAGSRPGPLAVPHRGAPASSDRRVPIALRLWTEMSGGPELP
jgi:hypothetical protein